jgi:hypothetical protein
LPDLTGNVLSKMMTTKNKNILTAVVLVAIAVILYLFAVAQAVSQ